MLGVINRPDFYEGDKVVTLSSTVKAGNVTKTKKFKVLVKAAPRTDLQSVIEDLNYIKIPEFTTSDLNFEIEGKCGARLNWSTNKVNIISNTGKVIRPAFNEEDAPVIITVVATKGTESKTKTFNTTVLAWTNEDEVSEAAKSITWSLIRNKNTDITKVTTDLILPTTIGNDITVTWTSSNTRYLSHDGKVTRPAYRDGDAMVSVTAVLRKGDLTSTATVNGINILKLSATNQERVEEYVSNFNFTVYIFPNTSLTELTSSFNLPSVYNDITTTVSIVNSDGQSLTSQYVTLTSDDTNKQHKFTIVRPSAETGNQEFYIKMIGNIPAVEVEGESIPQATYTKSFHANILALTE